MQQSHSMYKLCLINSLPWFTFVLLPEVRSFYSLSLSVQESWLLKLPFYRIISSQVKRIWQKGRLESLLQFLRLFVDEAPEVTLNTEIPHPAQTTSRVKQVWTNLLTHPMNPFKVAILRFSGRVCMCSNQLVKKELNPELAHATSRLRCNHMKDFSSGVVGFSSSKENYIWNQCTNVAAATDYLGMIQQTQTPATADKRPKESLCFLFK